MLPITGYADRWSVKPGETIDFMISSRDAAPYHARVARVFCGDPNPSGPGYREQAVPCAIEGRHAGAEQAVQPGSRAVIPLVEMGSAAQSGIRLTIWPTLPDKGPQCVLEWRGEAGSLWLGLLQGRLTAIVTWPGATRRIALQAPLEPRRWCDVGLLIDRAEGRVSLVARPHQLAYAPVPRVREEVGAVPPAVLCGPGTMLMAAAAGPKDHFNGRIEHPEIRDNVGSVAAWLMPAGLAGAEGLRASWDFSIGIGTDRVYDKGPNRFCGWLENLPTRAVTGAGWTGQAHNWTHAPQDYGAIHFHDDDVGDLAWRKSLALKIPQAWPSGLYVLHLETETGRDNIPFAVRAEAPGRQAKIAILLPTLTYQIYGQYPRGLGRSVRERSEAWGALVNTPDDHPEYGLCAYNVHGDGSGVSIVSMRRPMMDKRVNQIHRHDPHAGCSGTYWLAADTYILDWLDRSGIACEIITDHDLHVEGADLLSHYTAVMTGQHPEYHTEQTRDAISAYIETGGRFLYLGGNGFYWKTVPYQDSLWAIEVRRAEGGIRTWAAEPGESYHAFDGTLGGLWRRLGKPPQDLVGVGFTSQGDYHAEAYRFADGVTDPRIAFMTHGLEREAQPGQSFGERGLMGGGAAGHEVDRADHRLGTPGHALIVASGLPLHESFQPSNEERLTQEWPGPREALIRSDIVFFETASGGAVFSVGSMSFIGGLPIDGYDNTLARLLTNVLRRFADPAPFPWPDPPA